MKTLKDFLSESKLPDIEKTSILESHSFQKDPPNMIVLKRKAIRIFPDGNKVALYFADKINKYVSIPYSDMSNDKHIIQMHEKWTPKGNIADLMEIAESGEAGIIQFADNLSMKVDVSTARSIVNLYNKVNTPNKTKIEKMVNKDKNNFAKVAAFAHGAHTDLGS